MAVAVVGDVGGEPVVIGASSTVRAVAGGRAVPGTTGSFSHRENMRLKRGRRGHRYAMPCGESCKRFHGRSLVHIVVQALAAHRCHAAMSGQVQSSRWSWELIMPALR